MEITRTFDLLDHLVTAFPDKTDILAGKEKGEWVKYSTHDYYKYAHYMACGLLELGLQPGDKVVTIGGFHGKVVDVKESTVVISIAPNTEVEVEKTALVKDGSRVGQA